MMRNAYAGDTARTKQAAAKGHHSAADMPA